MVGAWVAPVGGPASAGNGRAAGAAAGPTGPGRAPSEALTLPLPSVPDPSRPAEAVMAAFRRPIGAPVAADQPVRLFLVNGPPPPGRLYLTNLPGTVSQTASGGYSGTCAATSDASASFSTRSAITAGVFTDAHQ